MEGLSKEKNNRKSLWSGIQLFGSPCRPVTRLQWRKVPNGFTAIRITERLSREASIWQRYATDCCQRRTSDRDTGMEMERTEGVWSNRRNEMGLRVRGRTVAKWMLRGFNLFKLGQRKTDWTKTNIAGWWSVPVPQWPTAGSIDIQSTKWSLPSDSHSELHRHEFVQKIVDALWKKWTRDHFPSLIVQQKWHTAQWNLMVGDIVLIQDSNQVRDNWKLCRVSKVKQGDDGKVRNVEVQYFVTLFFPYIMTICL